MIKRIVPAAILGLAAIGFTACNNNSFQKTKDGLEYRIVVDKKEGKTPTEKDLVKLKLRIYYTEKGKKDTLLNDLVAMNGGQALEIPVSVPIPYKSYWAKGLMLLTPGDSALFLTPVDTMLKYEMQGQPLPPFMKKGGAIMYSVVLESVRSAEDMQKEQQQKSAQQKDVDDKMLQDYFTQNKLAPTKTESGLYYIIDKEGNGNAATKGQKVTVKYTGKTLDGNVFDSNVDPKFGHVSPFSFTVGAGEVIPGWDEAATLMKTGSKARFFIPSPLAYGTQDRPGLPANSILMFDVEVTNIEAATIQ